MFGIMKNIFGLVGDPLNPKFIPRPAPIVIRFRWVTYTTQHKRGPAKGRRRYQFTSGRQTL